MSKQALIELREAVKAGVRFIESEICAVFGQFGTHGQGNSHLARNAYNGSLDAAKKLHEAMLPEWRWLIEAQGNATVYPPDEDLFKAIDVDGAASPARAWLIAILSALIVEGDT